MIEVRTAADRGHAEHGWLEARHTFSFSGYHDPRWMGYSKLRVINEDKVVPGAGFAPHGHRDMEIITYVLEGQLQHRDSTGGGAVLPHGELQVMTAGRGIRHSEFNASQAEPVHLLQIWIEPDRTGVAPGYQQKPLDARALRQGWSRVVGPAGSGTPFVIHADAALDIAWPGPGQSLRRELQAGRRHFLHVACGTITIGEHRLQAGDAAMLEREAVLELAVVEEAELLLFDLP